MKPFSYSFSSTISSKKMKQKKPSGVPYMVNVDKGEEGEGVLLDTFDNELLLSGKLLLQRGNMLWLQNFNSGTFVDQQIDTDWSYVSDLEQGPVTLQLGMISKLRALISVGTVAVKKDSGTILDDEGKTRVRFNNLVFTKGKKSMGVGCTQPLRGYGKAHEDLKEWLLKLGVDPCPIATDLYTFVGLSDDLYCAKPVITLSSTATVKISAMIIIQTFLGVARRNEDGVIGDYDTEFLHDYRVSLRKVRSVLSLFKGGFAGDETSRLKNEFSELMQQTNTLRDLDVYLLDQSTYYKLVPTTTHAGLDVLFAGLKKTRKTEHKKVVKYISGKNYASRIEGLEKVFSKPSNLESGANSDANGRIFGCNLILKRYVKVSKIARLIDKDTDDEVVHQLRIHCKKLRYLMEFFTPFFPAADIKSLIKSLKQLQDNLGRFNDYSVQQLFLKTILTSGNYSSGKGLMVAESIGALTAMLFRLQRKERNLVMKNFARFDSSEIRDCFNELFNVEGTCQ